jgi:hypothetical protein
MVQKTRSNCFGCYFYENNVSDVSFAKRIVWAAKNAIFIMHGHTQGIS